jgi:NADH dehydrogenase
MSTRSVATVFGGSGFIGRYVVRRLARKGYVVRVAVRDPERALFLKTAGAIGQIVPLYASVSNEATVRRAIEGSDIVVNLVGVLAERGKATFQAIHVDGAAMVAKVAAACGVTRLVHLSAIGADPASPSVYAQSKAAGEQAVRAAFPGATILRPSVVFGPEDHFFNLFGAMARALPFMPVISGHTRMQPVYVGDVADAVLASLERPDALGATYELGGPRVWMFREILELILRETGRDRALVNIPMSLARLEAAFLERLWWKPLTRDQLVLLSRDNVASHDMPGLMELGIEPTPAELIVPTYLARFQPNGGRRPLRPVNATE